MSKLCRSRARVPERGWAVHVREALDDAWDASNRYDGREAGRAFEDSPRGAC